ncbi:MAG: hypothetical protein OEL89_02575 [Candidatus Peregrinibacteria bacterium]|nr:hypothetical protein [Candidatus Peregrinibacteria bacterium]
MGNSDIIPREECDGCGSKEYTSKYNIFNLCDECASEVDYFILHLNRKEEGL